MTSHLARLFFDSVRRAEWSIPDAVFHLVDNALDAGARHVRVFIRPEASPFEKSIEVMDDGAGMDEAGLRLSLALGEGSADPHRHGVFGLGLKAAAVQGERLEIVSSPGRGVPFCKRVVRLGDVEATGRYVASTDPLSVEDTVLVGAHLPGGRGTLVRVGGVPLGGSTDSLLALLQSGAGLVYAPLLRDGLALQIGGTRVHPIDPLRASEADAHEEGEPDCKHATAYRWLQPSARLPLASEPRLWSALTATRRRTGVSGGLNRRLDAPEHDGLYVYRNHRLIAGPLHCAGLPADDGGGLCGFRGRLDVTGTADAALGLTLAKNTASLSDEAEEALARIVTRALRRDDAAAAQA